MANNHMPHPAFGGTVSAVVFNHLMMPGKDPVLVPIKFAAAQTLQAGSVLGIDNTGFAKLSLAAAGDGSEVPVAILLEDLDTTAGIKTFSAALEGAFNETALIYGTGHTADTVRVPLLKKGIYLSAPRYSFA